MGENSPALLERNFYIVYKFCEKSPLTFAPCIQSVKVHPQLLRSETFAVSTVGENSPMTLVQ